MSRWTSLLAIVILAVASRSPSRAQSPSDLAQTAAHVASHQNPDGGFAPAPGQPSSLGATSEAVRILKYVGGSIPDVLKCIKYVQSCRVGGGFAQTPDAEPDSITTSIGLIAAGELKIVDPGMVDGAVAFFHEHAQDREQVRMAIAGLEAAGAKSADVPRWLEQIRTWAGSDGSHPEPAEQAFLAGTVAATILRVGERLDDPKAAAAAIKAGQRPDGGWSKTGGPSDLATSYRVMRALFLMNERPDLGRLRGFIARCRRPDGSYSNTPEATASLGATYFATIMTSWSRQLEGEPPLVETAGFTPLFNGRDLEGWEGDESIWSVRDGMIVGKSGKLDHNVFLATKSKYRDFVLSLTFRVIDGEGNSGVQFRSMRVPGTEMSGYQADIGEGYWGSLYDESRRNKTLVQGSPRALERLHKSDWNHYLIQCFGGRITIYLNGETSVEYTETDGSIARDGLIALQVHSGDPMEVQFKDVMLQHVPSPELGDADRPGFHTRRIETKNGARTFTVYVPANYDASKSYPAILFLHGAGERGDDGVTPARVGLGPAIVQRGGVPAFVVFPQARQTWRSESEDASAALLALDEVMKAYTIDPSRVILTGLSMGGMGTWSIAAAHPDKFAAIVPVCGPGKPDDAEKYRGIPVKGFVGDADSPRLHLGMRAMIEALRSAGEDPDYTEYRNVPHNSWDRAYNDPETIDWMLTRRRP